MAKDRQTNTVTEPVCFMCARLLAFRRCEAFEVVPDEIWLGKNYHRNPYPGDNGIQFEPIEDEEPKALAARGAE